MSTDARSRPALVVDYDPAYPWSDGKPMSDSTEQYQWIVTIVEGIRVVFRDDLNVFVAGDLLWYPVEGQPKIRAAPDALVAFGRPAGHRPCYMQWREEGIAPQVAVEVISRSNRPKGMQFKFEFYERYGVEEYYLYDFKRGRFSGYLRRGGRLEPIAEPVGWTSPRMGIHFDLRGKDLVLTGPDGTAFRTFQELDRDARELAFVAEEERERADAEAERAQRALRRAEAATEKADAERQKADAERQRADAERQKAERLAAKLRELGVDPDA